MDVESDAPDWLVVGRSVAHGSFGTGTVSRIGEYKGEATVWVDFDYGERKALSLAFGLPYLSPRRRWARRTARRPDLRCDVCGQRPLVISTHGQNLCQDHVARFRA